MTGDVTQTWQKNMPHALAELGLEPVAVSDTMWMVVLEGVNKRSLPVSLTVKERSLHVTAFLSAPPDEAHGDVYRLLLSRNQHVSLAHYAVDDAGQLVINGRIPLGAVTEAGLDAVLGEVLALADDVFPAVLARGFASYIDTEQQWRAAAGLPPNPISGERTP